MAEVVNLPERVSTGQGQATFSIARILTVACCLLTCLAFSSDLRLGWNFEVGSKPSFQLFEFAAFGLFAIFLPFLPFYLTRKTFRIQREDVFLILFVCVAFVIAPFSSDVNHNVSRAKDFLVCAGLYFFLKYGPLHKVDIKVVLAGTLTVALFWSVIGIMQWAGYQDVFWGDSYRLFIGENARYKLDFGTGELATSFAHGGYLYPQNFVYYLVFPLFIGFMFAYRHSVFVIAPVIVFLAILGTLSKTFLMLLVLFVNTYMVYGLLKSVGATAFWMAFEGVLVWLLCLYGLDPTTVANIFGTLTWRFDIWTDAIAMLGESPEILFFGGGTHHMRETFSRVAYPNPHNLALYFIVEYGLVGAALFLGFLAVSTKRVIASFVRFNDKESLPWVLFGHSLVFFIFMGLVDDIFVQTQLTGLYMFYLGLYARYLEIHRTDGLDAELKA